MQRIPRYELLIKVRLKTKRINAQLIVLSLLQRLLESTDPEHGDYAHLQKAEVAVHELAMRINTMKESQRDECLQDTLKKLELLLLTDVKIT